MLQRALAHAEKRITESGASVTCGPMPDIMGDELRITQLFQHLIANAVKFKERSLPRSP